MTPVNRPFRSRARSPDPYLDAQLETLERLVARHPTAPEAQHARRTAARARYHLRRGLLQNAPLKRRHLIADLRSARVALERNTMNSKTDVNAARQTIAQLEADLATLDRRAADLEAERAQLTAALKTERAVIAAASAEAQRAASEPVHRERLAVLTATLRARLRSAPPRSPTAQRIRKESARLADENTPAADRLALCRSLLDDLAWRVELDFQHWAAPTGGG